MSFLTAVVGGNVWVWIAPQNLIDSNFAEDSFFEVRPIGIREQTWSLDKYYCPMRNSSYLPL
jgi:hypothetical protein